MLRLLTAGESHGKCLIGIVEGLPRGVVVDVDFINRQLRRRQLGPGRGRRMEIENDTVEILSGVRHGITVGSPISFMIQNRDYEHWRIPMSVDQVAEGADIRCVYHPRPGHADLAGALKYQTHDMRDVLERASARETAARVAGGGFCRLFLTHFGIRIASHVVAIGGERIAPEYEWPDCQKIFELDDFSLRCTDPEAEKRMIRRIEEARAEGDTLGGIVEVVASTVPPGLGSHLQWDKRLDAQIAQALMSIPSVKAVEIGAGIDIAQKVGSMAHDEIYYDSQAKRFYRSTNRAGGLEGGISNGADIRARIYFKPVPTLRRPLRSVNVQSKQPTEAAVERSDTCVVLAGGVIAESMLGFVLASAFLEKFGGDSIMEIEQNYSNFNRLLDQY